MYVDGALIDVIFLIPVVFPERYPTGHWQAWGEWSQCTASCGRAVRIRTRICLYGGTIPSKYCNGKARQIVSCTLEPCHEHGYTEHPVQRHLKDLNEIDLSQEQEYLNKIHLVKSERGNRDVVGDQGEFEGADDITPKNANVTFTPKTESGTPMRVPNVTTQDIASSTVKPHTVSSDWTPIWTWPLASINETAGKPVSDV